MMITHKEMISMKVLLTTLNSKYSHVNIALYYLKNVLQSLCEPITIQATINDALDHILEKIIESDAKVICFGCYIWNIESTLKLCQNIKSLRPDCTIVLGGPEVSYEPEEIVSRYRFVDAIICTQAETAIVECIQDIKHGRLQPIYQKEVQVTDIPRIATDILEHYDNRVVYFETSRGCPYRCSYCLSCIDKSIQYFPLEQVKEDLQLLLDANVKQIRFIDRTFNSDRKRALEIWKFLLQRRQDTTFHFEICAALLDKETLTFLKQVPKGAFQFEIGVQSTNPKTLEAIHRTYRWNQEKQIIQTLAQMDTIKLHTDLIVGLPYEDLKHFQSSFNELYSLHTQEVQIGFLKFLKGTTIYKERHTYDYQYTQQPPYEVLQNTFISFEEIRFLKKLETVFESIYNSGCFTNTLSILEPLFNTPYALFETITHYFIQHQLFERKISMDEIFKTLYDMFCKEKNHSLIQQALTYDYFLSFKGTRDWFYAPYHTILKEKIRDFTQKNRTTLFANQPNAVIYKTYQFCMLDYNFKTHQEEKEILYYKKK